MEDIRLSENFSLSELTASQTARRKGINNIPDQSGIAKLKRLATEVLQPIRDRVGKSIHVNSGYRCPRLNTIVGGAKRSQHVLCEAADLSLGSKASNKVLFETIKGMIEAGEIKVGQLINEYGYSWIHVSLPTLAKNNQVLKIG